MVVNHKAMHARAQGICGDGRASLRRLNECRNPRYDVSLIAH
jgi:hypothetical protein